MPSQDIRRLGADALEGLRADHRPPCVSIYMPVVTAFPGEMENGPRLRQFASEVKQQLVAGYSGAESQSDIKAMLEQLRHLGDEERAFWTRRLSGLAIFCAPGFFMAIDLPQRPAEAVVVADRFQLMPLMKMLQTTDRYQVLALTRKDFKLFEGDRDRLREIPLGDLPHTITQQYFAEADQANAADESGEPKQYHTDHQQPPTGALPLERYFRAVDCAVWDHFSRDAGLPLILCCLEEPHVMFRRVSHNLNLQEQWIKLDPTHAPLDRIRAEAWAIIEPRLQQWLRKLIDNFEVAQAHHTGSNDPIQVAEAAANGRVATLLVGETKHIQGKLEPSGAVIGGNMLMEHGDDLIEGIADQVIKTKGEVVVVPPELMPTDTGLAAIYRY